MGCDNAINIYDKKNQQGKATTLTVSEGARYFFADYRDVVEMGFLGVASYKILGGLFPTSWAFTSRLFASFEQVTQNGASDFSGNISDDIMGLEILGVRREQNEILWEFKELLVLAKTQGYLDVEGEFERIIDEANDEKYDYVKRIKSNGDMSISWCPFPDDHDFLSSSKIYAKITFPVRVVLDKYMGINLGKHDIDVTFYVELYSDSGTLGIFISEWEADVTMGEIWKPLESLVDTLITNIVENICGHYINNCNRDLQNIGKSIPFLSTYNIKEVYLLPGIRDTWQGSGNFANTGSIDQGLLFVTVYEA